MWFWEWVFDIGLAICVLLLSLWSLGHEVKARYYDWRIGVYERRKQAAEGAAAAALNAKIETAKAQREAYRGPLKALPLSLFLLALLVFVLRIARVIGAE
ncbi:hypothetical protein [Shimia sp.]|uniref:hypothetical protein n=1 Tax=Shimia sp. TaxID=1954381 RepID=UPI003B8AD10D